MNEQFFNNLALEVGTNDVEFVRKIYYGILRTVIKGLGSNKSVIFPEFGEFYVKEQKSKMLRDINTGEMRRIDSVHTPKFRAYSRLKEYVKVKNKS